MEAINIIAYTNDATHIEAVKALFKALKVKFELTKEKKEVNYNPEFVAKIKKSKEDYLEGRYRTVKISELDTFLGIE